MLQVYDIQENELVYVYWDKKIHQAKLQGIIYRYRCSENERILMEFNIAGIGIKEIRVGTAYRFFYSLEDAKEGRNKVQAIDFPLSRINDVAPNWFIKDAILTYKWNGVTPVPVSLPNCFSIEVYLSNGTAIIRDYCTKKEIPVPSHLYKTAERCRAENEAEVVTF